MEQQRSLAYTLATVIEPEELEEIAGGSGPIIIPTIRVTGAPLLPDTVHETH